MYLILFHLSFAKVEPPVMTPAKCSYKLAYKLHFRIKYGNANRRSSNGEEVYELT
jgi:hypothetical protein